jgi:hypothetical protein
MGVVYRARDQSLDREVAVKILLDKYSPGSATAARFVDEAKITGQLQHPGIPAIYQFGELADGRPFLAMKLIKGDTLESKLTAKSPVNVQAVFEAVCQAVAYAHDHGVIHRDLKPANIMVGAFAEVQVMDWGLAKTLASGVASPRRSDDDPDATAGSSEVRSPRESSLDNTQAGAILGTPSYMSPEQAAGEVEKIDKRSDVFGLGSVLCRMLTGKPPFDGANAEAVRLNAVRGRTEAAFARLTACGAEPELVALCRRCLAFEPADRPVDAGAVATEVARLRAAAVDRARQAELDRATAAVRTAEATKRRRMRFALVASILLFIALAWVAGSWAWWVHEQKVIAEGKATAEGETRKAKATQEFDSVFGRAEEHFKAAREKGTAGGAELAAAAELTKTAERSAAAVGPGEETKANLLAAEIAAEQAGHALAAAVDAAIEAAIDRAKQVEEDVTDPSVSTAIPKLRAAFARAGLEIGKGSPAAAAARFRTRPAADRDRILHGLEILLVDAAFFRPNVGNLKWLHAVLNAADPDAWRARVRDVDLLPLDERRAGYRELCADLDPARQPGWAVFWLVRRGRYTDVDDATLFGTLRRTAEFHYGDHLVVSQWIFLAYARKKPNFVQEILLASPAALAQRPNDPFALFLHGYGLTLAGRPADALPFLRRSLALRPEFAKARVFAAVCLFALGKPSDGAAQLRPAFAEAREARLAAQWVAEAVQYGAAVDSTAVADAAIGLSDDPATSYQFLTRLGESLLGARKTVGAEPFLRRAVGPAGTVTSKPEEARAKLFARLAACRLAGGDIPVALAHLRSAYDADPRAWRATAGTFLSSIPSLPERWREFVAASEQLVPALSDQKQFDTALDAYILGHAGPEGRQVTRARAARAAAADPDETTEVAPPPRPAR